MLSLSGAIQIVIWISPWAIPRVIALYQSIKTPSRPDLVRPPPPRVQYCLNALLVFIALSLIGTLPHFSPSNIFRETNSRLQVPNGVLFNRLHNSRNGNLTPVELVLKSRYSDASLDWALLYAAYGPDVLAYCSFCRTDEPNTFLIYAIPSMLFPHLLHIFLLGMITSSFFSGAEGVRWRIYATIAGVSLAAAELTLTLRYDWKLNTTRQVQAEVDFFFWRIRTMRLLAFATVDAMIGWILWLTSTNRWLALPSSITQQLDSASTLLQVVHNKLQTLGQLQNAVLRDDELRSIGFQYWTREPMLMEKVEQEREVIDARRLALSRMDYDRVRSDADSWVDKVWQALKSPGHSIDRGKTE